VLQGQRPDHAYQHAEAITVSPQSIFGIRLDDHAPSAKWAAAKPTQARDTLSAITLFYMALSQS